MIKVQILDADSTRPRGQSLFSDLRARAPAAAITHRLVNEYPEPIDQDHDFTVVIVHIEDVFAQYRAADFLSRLSTVTNVIVITDDPFNRVNSPPFEILVTERDRPVSENVVSYIVDRIADEEQRRGLIRDVGENLQRALAIRVVDLKLPTRLQNTLYINGIESLGDIVRRTEAQLLRIPDLGRTSFLQIRSIVRSHGLRLGMDLPDRAPDDPSGRSQLDAAARKLAEVRQEPLGATFKPADEVLAIDAKGADNDFEVAAKSYVQQLHDEIRRKATRFTHVASRLDNQPGWQGIGGYCERLERLLSRPTDEIPNVIGSLYSATLELGSFLEMDRAIAAGGSGFAVELDPEVRRPLQDLLSSLAPWMRSFPTVRQMDDEAGRFLAKNQLVDSATSLVESAETTRLVAPADLAVLRGLADAARRGEFQGIKASHREVLSVRNLILAASVAVGGLLWNAAESEFATHSVIGKKAGTFLAASEVEVLRIVSELPRDIQLAVELLIEEAKRQPPLPSRAPSEPSPPSQPPVRRRRR